MHKFIDNIIAFSLKNKFFIFFFTVLAVIAGIVSFKHTPIDAFPDVTNTKVTIITQWPGGVPRRWRSSLPSLLK
jgi:cobalt-zinc-cadmium resistance protein CzcA